MPQAHEAYSIATITIYSMLLYE